MRLLGNEIKLNICSFKFLLLGVCVWQEGDALVLQITNVDASPQSQLSSGLLKLHAGLDGESSAVMDLYEGTQRFSFQNGVKIDIRGGGSERMLISVEDPRQEQECRAELCGWDTSCIRNKSFRWQRCVKNSADWDKFDFYDRGDTVMMSRGFAVPVCASLDLKKAARAAGVKSVSMIRQKELEPLTGYVHGGCSPVGMKKRLRTFVHESAAALPQIYVSAGKTGRQMRLSPADLLSVTGAAFADLTAE